MILKPLYLQKDGEVVAFSASPSLEAPDLVAVRVQKVRNGVPEPSDVTDLLPEADFRQLLADHRAAGYLECNRFGRPPLAGVAIQPPLPPAVIPGAQAVPPEPLPAEPGRELSLEPPVPKAKPLSTLEEILQTIRAKSLGWDTLSAAAQHSRRNAIYGLRNQARKAAKAEGVGLPDFSPIPKISADPDEALDDAEGVEAEENVVCLDGILDTIGGLKRQLWLVMADIQGLEAGDQVCVAASLRHLASAVQAAASSLVESA